MMHTGWSSGKKKADIGRLIDWLVGIPSLLEFRHYEGSEVISRNSKQLSSPDLIGGSQY